MRIRLFLVVELPLFASISELISNVYLIREVNPSAVSGSFPMDIRRNGCL